MVAKLHTTQPYNWEAFKTTIRKIWRPTKTIRFHELGLGLMMVEFEDSLDKERVLRDYP